MVDTVKSEEIVEKLARFIDDHKGQNTVVINMCGQSAFTDFFIISTATSWAHMKGLYREIREFLLDQGIRPFHQQKSPAEDSWLLMDCGNFVVHLMDGETRDFFELEELWFQGTKISYSSKSSKSSPSS